MASTDPLFDRPKAADPRIPEKPRRTPAAVSRQRALMIAGLVLVIIITAVVTYNVRSCQTDLVVKANRPVNVAALLTKSLKDNDFAAFQALLTDTARIRINSDKFGEFQKLNTPTTLNTTYTLVRLENGRLLLVYLSAPDETGLYKIKDIKLVPTEMASLFTHAE